MSVITDMKLTCDFWNENFLFRNLYGYKHNMYLKNITIFE